MLKRFFSVLIIIFLFLMSSCINQKKITYFNNLPDSSVIKLDYLQVPPSVVQINDILDIRIGGENEKTVQYINQYFGGGAAGGGAAGGGASSTNSSGGGMQVMVDVNGFVDLPKIGKVKVGGLTKDQVKDTLTAAYGEYLKDAIITVSLSSFRFTVLGEVRGPGYYSLTNEKINIFEAIAQAGDLTPYSRRDNVKIIRDNNGKREIISVNLNDKSILNSPNYYLNRYDIIYVESQRLKIFSQNYATTTAIIASLTSFVALFLVIFKI